MFWSCCALCPTGGSQPKSMLLKPSTIFTTVFAMISTLSWSGWLQVSSISFLIMRSWCHFPNFHYLLDFQIASKHPQGSNQIWAQGPTYMCTIRDEAFGVLLLDQVKDGSIENHGFERNWLEAEHKAQAEAIWVRWWGRHCTNCKWGSTDGRVWMWEWQRKITHKNGLVILDSASHALAMYRLWHTSFILITLPCNINDIPPSY